MNFIFFNLWTPDEMFAAQGNLAQAADAINASVSACTALDATTRSGWQGFYTNLKAFTAQKPALLYAGPGEALTTGPRADQLQSLQNELTAWQNKLSAKCNLNPGLSQAPPVGPQLESIIRWAAIGVGAVAVAVVVTRVVPARIARSA